MSKMKYTTIPYVNKPVSRIIYGTATPPFLQGEDVGDLLSIMYGLGVTAFDTARVYEKSEACLGRWMEEKGLRDNVVILSKCGHPDHFNHPRVSEKEIRKDFYESSQYLRTDYIDIYLLHRDDKQVLPGTIVEIFNGLHTEGKIGSFGGSNWSHQRVEEANEYAYKHSLIPFTVSSPNFGLANQVKDPWGNDCVSISGPANAAARAWYIQNTMPIIAFACLGSGFFSGRLKSSHIGQANEVLDDIAIKGFLYEDNIERLRRVEKLASEKGYTVPQIAMAWIFGQQLDTMAVVGTTREAGMQDNIDALHITLSQSELDYLDLING